MPTTRRAVLVTLKRHGPMTTQELASKLGLSVPAVRQQVLRLADDGLLVRRAEREHRGRPSHHYELAGAADVLFPTRYGDLTTELLGYLGGPEAAEVTALFDKRRQRRLDEARSRLEGLTLDRQVNELARILDEDGYLADVQQLAQGRWLITEHNCAILSVATGYRQACTSEIGFLRDTLPGARVERIAHRMDGAHVCAYEISAEGSVGRAAPGSGLQVGHDVEASGR